MAAKYLLGVDIGTQSAKVVLFDLEGQIVAQAQTPLRPLAIPQPQSAEHPDDDLWSALQSSCQKVMAQFRRDVQGDPRDILALGLCGIRCCRVLLKEDGQLAWPVINWMDARLNEPYRYEERYGDVRYVTTTSGYLTHRLTGEFKDTSANHIGFWPMDDQTRTWAEDPKAYDECRVPRRMLFDLVQPGEVLGQLTTNAAEATGLPMGLPVVATAHDKAVEALGSGSLEAGTLQISLGTYIAAFLSGETYVQDPQSYWVFQASRPDAYLYECMGVRRGMWTVSWAFDQLGGRRHQQDLSPEVAIEESFDRMAKDIPAGSEGLITIHDWAPPPEATYRRGVMLGFDGRHTAAHMYRSLLEGIALTLKNHVDPMLDERATQLQKIVASGGGSNSNLLMQILADVFGVATSRNEMTAAVAVGCAINAGLAVGVLASYEEANSRFIKRGDQFSPDKGRMDTYQRLNREVYRDAQGATDPLLKKLDRLDL